jgi:hypothetical protein
MAIAIIDSLIDMNQRPTHRRGVAGDGDGIPVSDLFDQRKEKPFIRGVKGAVNSKITGLRDGKRWQANYKNGIYHCQKSPTSFCHNHHLSFSSRNSGV